MHQEASFQQEAGNDDQDLDDIDGTYDNVEQQTVSEHEQGEHEQEKEYDVQSLFYEDRDEINNDHSQMMYDQTASVVPDDCSQ